MDLNDIRVSDLEIQNDMVPQKFSLEFETETTIPRLMNASQREKKMKKRGRRAGGRRGGGGGGGKKETRRQDCLEGGGLEFSAMS